MVQCEMCGTETGAPKTVKVEGAELDVCSSCAEFGTEVRTQESTGTSTKYSTGGSGSGSGSGSGAGTSSGGGGGGSTAGSGGSAGGGRRRDMFDEMDEVAQDYHRRIREARESRGLSQEDLADQLNEKASLIRKLEHGDTLPSDGVQRKLERALDIDLTEGVDADADADADAEWEGGTSTGSYTLGDVVERKD